jgi:hypothetical protein
MNPADLANRIAALDWSATSLEHQLAVGAAVASLKGFEPMTAFEAASGVAVRKTYADGTSEALSAIALFGATVSPADLAQRINAHNVVQLPVRKRTCWTTLHQLDGRAWSTSSHFGPRGAWNWILEAVALEHNVSEDQIGCIESDETQPYNCDDLVTIDGLPVYRISHLVK